MPASFAVALSEALGVLRLRRRKGFILGTRGAKQGRCVLFAQRDRKREERMSPLLRLLFCLFLRPANATRL